MKHTFTCSICLYGDIRLSSMPVPSPCQQQHIKPPPLLCFFSSPLHLSHFPIFPFVLRFSSLHSVSIYLTNLYGLTYLTLNGSLPFPLVSTLPSPAFFSLQQRGEWVSSGAAGATRLCPVSLAWTQHPHHQEVQRNINSGWLANTAEMQ